MPHRTTNTSSTTPTPARRIARAGVARGAPRWRVPAVATFLIALGGTLNACADVPAAFGPTTQAARTNANDMLGAFAERFTNVYRAPRYARAREVLGRYALTPSAIYNDTSIWTAQGSDNTRTLFGDASIVNGRYVFNNVPTNAPLDQPGDGRHIMRLHKQSSDEYDWFTGVDFAVGHITANDFARVVNRWLAVTEGRPGNALRQDARTAFPRTTVAMGALFTIDTLISTPHPQGGNTVYAGIRLTPEGIRATLPNYADYLDKYIKRMKMRMTLSDKRGATWVDIGLRDGYFTLRLRSKDGHFAPLDGPLATMPDTLVLHVDASAKVSIFTVGLHDLIGEWVNLESEHERGWAMRFTKEPEWDLPPTAGMFLRSPLRRPFHGAGTQFRITIRDTPGQQTILARRATTAVQESAVLRFLGKLGGAAMGDFVSKAEEEENRFNVAMFSALEADMAALLK